VYDAGEIVGGTTILNLKKCIVNTFLNLDQKKTGSLDFCLIIYYKRVCRKRYFDFGISNVDKGKKLNEGLTY
jgi:hypothetical protein